MLVVGFQAAQCWTNKNHGHFSCTVHIVHNEMNERVKQCARSTRREKENHTKEQIKRAFCKSFSPIFLQFRECVCVCVCVRCFFLLRSSFSDFYHRSICVCGAFISLTNVVVVVVVVVVCVVIRFELYNVVGRPQLPYSWADFLRVTTHEPWLCHKFCHIIPFHCVALFCVGLRFCCTRFGSVWFGLVFPSLSLSCPFAQHLAHCILVLIHSFIRAYFFLHVITG